MLLLNDLRKSEKKPRKNSYQKESNQTPLIGGRIPPQDLESEKAFLGSLLLNGEALYDVADLVSRDSFYAEKHAIIFDCIENLLLHV